MLRSVPEKVKVVAVDHEDGSPSTLKTVQKLFSTDEKKILFIEMTQDYWEAHRFWTPKPFDAAIALAQRNGWKVVFMDRKKIYDFLDAIIKKSRYFPTLKRSKPSSNPIYRYAMYNLREKDWARKIAQEKSQVEGIVMMHPNHVKGFLKETGLAASAVQWISKPHREAGRRLPLKQVQRVMRKRAIQKKVGRKRV